LPAWETSYFYAYSLILVLIDLDHWQSSFTILIDKINSSHMEEGTVYHVLLLADDFK
jgi:hypothetical protein